MKYDSKIVTSNQGGIHKDLDKMVNRYLNSEYRKPFQAHNLQAFEQLERWLDSQGSKPLILDSCCGTAMSSRKLAMDNLDALVIGVDQSYARLNKKDDSGELPKPVPNNCLLLRANCEDIWRLCQQAGINFEKHYILYPNPWPKPHHLKRRWHGHPVFPLLPELASDTIVRSNWKTYLDEFERAWQLCGGHTEAVEPYEFQQPLTLFETKYHESGQTLYQLRAHA